MTGGSQFSARAMRGGRSNSIDPRIAAEAAAWIAHMHGPNRTDQTERDLLRWQLISPAHREALERCTDVWQDVSRVDARPAPGNSTSERATATWTRIATGVGERVRLVAAGLAVTGVATTLAMLALPGPNFYRTAVGEQRLVSLKDGSRMLMNTNTRLRVDFTKAQRTVEVESGEVFFEVAKDSQHPFVVRVAGTEVVAVGTAFSVRYAATGRSSDELAVTLVEGRVKVRPAKSPEAVAPTPGTPVLMTAGERLVLENPDKRTQAKQAPKVDRPNVDHLMAWKVREADFDNVSLQEAVSEMNRYSRKQLALGSGLRASELRVSGMYRVDDLAGFAQAVASLHGLAVREQGGRIELLEPR